MWCCARKWRPSRHSRRITRRRTSSSCCARMASCICSGMTTPTRTGMPRCSGCRTACSAAGGPPAPGPPGQQPCPPGWKPGKLGRTGRSQTNPGDAAMAWLVAAAVVLALLAGLCVSTEVALIRVARAGTGDLGRTRGGDGAARLTAVLADAPVYLSVLLLIQICAETAATVLVTLALVQWLGVGWQAFLIAAAAMSLLLFVVAGIGPRTLGRRYQARVAAAGASVLYPLVRLLGPLPRLLTAAGGHDAGRAGREGGQGSDEDLRGLVDLLEQRRIIEPGEREMIHSVFELGETIVREVMVPRTDIVFVERDKTVQQVLSLALRSGFSRIPVVGENEDDVIGIAYLKDLVQLRERQPGQETAKVESVMRPATFVPE